MTKIKIGICEYPSVLKSAVYGFEEMFLLTNRLCRELKIDVVFEPNIVSHLEQPNEDYTVILLPPASVDEYYLSPNMQFIQWLQQRYSRGNILAAVCAGVFILASTGCVKKREITTHWALADKLTKHFPELSVTSDKILIDHGDMITAGGMMSWLDLGFELVNKYSSKRVVQRLGKTLVIDTAHRKQSYYQQFNPSFSHGDIAITAAQQFMHQNFFKAISIKGLAKQVNLTERTLQRRFLKATGQNPNHYLQRLRIQKVCDYLESTHQSFEWIANQVGYEDVSACRKVFINIIGLTPREFKKRFC